MKTTLVAKKYIIVSIRFNSSIHSRIQTKKKRSHGSQITLIILNEEMEDINKIVKSFEDFGLLIKNSQNT